MRNLLKILLLTAVIFSLGLNARADVLEFAQTGNMRYSKQDESSNKYLYFLKLSLNKHNPDFAVFLGNNVNKASEENVIGLMQKLYPLKMPYYMVFGRTDTNKMQGLDKNTYLDILSAFNKKQKRGKNYYFFKPNRHFICMVLDDTSNFVPSKYGEVPDEQLAQLEKLLIKNPKKMFIIFQHSPLIAADENYKFSMLNSDKYREIIKKYQNILIVSSGGYKKETAVKDDDGVMHITAPDFSDEAHSYQLIKIIYDKKNFKSRDNIKIEIKNVKV